MTPPPRLKAGIFVRALTRRAEVAGASAFVVRMGSEEAGAVILRVNRLDGTCLVLNQARDGKGNLVWSQPLGGWAAARLGGWAAEQLSGRAAERLGFLAAGRLSCSAARCLVAECQCWAGICTYLCVSWPHVFGQHFSTNQQPNRHLHDQINMTTRMRSNRGQKRQGTTRFFSRTNDSDFFFFLL